MTGPSIPVACRLLRSLCVVASLGVAGCQSTRQADAIVRTMAADAGIADDIEFHNAGDPVDLRSRHDLVLSLPDAVRLALRTSPSVQQALARVRSARADALQARLLPNPVLSVAFRLPEGGGKPVIEAGLAGDLVSLLQRGGKTKAADQRLRAASAEVIVVALDVIGELETHYITSAAIEASIAVLGERLTLLGRLRDLAEARLRAGEGIQLDVTTLDAQRVELETDIAEQRQELAEERLGLARLLGEPSGAADWKLDRAVISGDTLAGEADYVAEALRRRPEVAVLRWQLTALGVDLRLAGFAPFEGGEVGVDSERDEQWSVGPALSVPLPIFDWGQAKRSRIRAERVETVHKLNDQRRKVIEEVRRAYAAVRSTLSVARRVRSELVPLQQRRRDQAEAAYKTGHADVTALLLADNDLQTARAKLVDLERKVSLANSRLRRAVGGPAVADRLSPTTTAPSVPAATSPAEQR